MDRIHDLHELDMICNYKLYITYLPTIKWTRTWTMISPYLSLIGRTKEIEEGDSAELRIWSIVFLPSSWKHLCLKGKNFPSYLYPKFLWMSPQLGLDSYIYLENSKKNHFVGGCPRKFLYILMLLVRLARDQDPHSISSPPKLLLTGTWSLLSSIYDWRHKGKKKTPTLLNKIN